MQRSLSAVLLGLACGACDAQEPRDARSRAPDASALPNVILVSIDSLRYDHLGCYAYHKPTSPTIDRLASEGVRFETAVSTTSWTLPAHAALFTGLFDSTHGLVDNGLKLADAHQTLAEAMRSAGYQTAGFFGGPYLHPTFGLDQGFDHYQSCMTEFKDTVAPDKLRGAIFLGQDPSHHDATGPRTAKEVTSWLGKADKRPLFLFVHLWDVHYDYIAPESYVRMFDPDYEGTLTGRDFIKNQAISPEMAPRDFQHLLALYDAEIRYTDDTLKAILGELEKHGRLTNSLVIVTADHGEEFFEHGQKGHQKTLYEEVVRVPLVLHWPGRFPPGAVFQNPVRLVDLMPTILDLVGASPPEHVQGRSLKKLMHGEKLADEPALLELLVDKKDMRALRTEAFKTISAGKGQRAVLYDMQRDPRELRPLDPESQAAVQAFQLLTRSTAAVLEFRQRLAIEPEPVAVDPKVLQSLHSLGYTEK